VEDNNLNYGHRIRIRKKFLMNGSDSFLDYELLELLLTYVIPRKDVKPIAKNLLNKFGSLSKIINSGYDDLVSINGVKEHFFILIKLIKEFSVRILHNEVKQTPILNNYEKLLDYCWINIKNKNVEQFHILYLDNNFNLINDEILQEGTINYAVIYPREVIKHVISHGAVSVIILHNHPTENIEYSQNDLDITLKIRDSLKGIDVILIDHIIIGTNKSYFSFKNAGILQ